jgi:hypothetical protein
VRTTITIDDDVHEFAAYYARARGITLSAAIGELIRRAENAPEPAPNIHKSPNGLPMFPPVGNAPALTGELVKKLEDEAFDPAPFA